MRRSRAHSGFTLPEVLATMALAAVVLPVALHGISTATSAGSLARSSTEAVTLAQAKLDELVATGGWHNANNSGDFGADYPGYRWSVAAVQHDTDLMELTIEVAWTAAGRERTTRLTTLVYSQVAP